MFINRFSAITNPHAANSTLQQHRTIAMLSLSRVLRDAQAPVQREESTPTAHHHAEPPSTMGMGESRSPYTGRPRHPEFPNYQGMSESMALPLWVQRLPETCRAFAQKNLSPKRVFSAVRGAWEGDHQLGDMHWLYTHDNAVMGRRGSAVHFTTSPVHGNYLEVREALGRVKQRAAESGILDPHEFDAAVDGPAARFSLPERRLTGVALRRKTWEEAARARGLEFERKPLCGARGEGGMLGGDRVTDPGGYSAVWHGRSKGELPDEYHEGPNVHGEHGSDAIKDQVRAQRGHAINYDVGMPFKQVDTMQHQY